MIGRQVAQAEAEVGNPAVTWFGTFPPIVVVLEGRLVAAITIRRIEAVVVADMAGGARRRRWRHMRSRQGKSGSTVIERRRSPTGGRMASRAIRHCKSRSGCGVHRRGGLLPSRQMALRISAIGRGDHQCVIAINVAQSAGHVGVPIR